MPDTIRDKLWADVYAQAHALGRHWLPCREQADAAVHWYDKRPTATQAAPAAASAKESA